MKNKKIIIFLVCFLAGVAAFCIHQATTRKYNVLLITLDTTRPDRLGCYGYQAAHTPTLDSIAQEGTRFTQAIAPVPITLPSHASILTGLDVSSHGVRENGAYVLGQQFATLPEMLQSKGYTTSAVIAAFVLDRRFGTAQGFDFYNDRIALDKEGHREKGKAFHWQGFSVTKFERSAREISDRAIHWLANNAHKKFFLWVHFFDPHDPYTPPQEYASIGEGEFKGYDGEVAFMDHEIGKIIATLKEKKLLHKTLVVIASDHGEVLGEHLISEGRPYVGHGLFTYDLELRTVLMFRLPNCIPENHTINDMVKVSDITPTILDILNIKSKTAFDGESLYPTIQGKEKRNLKDIYCETQILKRRYNKSAIYALRTDTYKLIRMHDDRLTILFDLSNDPQETKNVFNPANPLHQELLQNLENSIAHWDTAEDDAAQEMDEETREKLKSLGYL